MKKFKRNIDCLENIISLCPNCHKGIHLGNNEVKINKLNKLYKLRSRRLKNVGIYVTIDEIYNVYNVKI